MQNFKLLYIHVFCIAQTALQKKWLNSIPGLCHYYRADIDIFGINSRNSRKDILENLNDYSPAKWLPHTTLLEEAAIYAQYQTSNM